MNPDSLIHGSAIVNPRQQIVQQGDTFEDTAFTPGFENVKFYTMLVSQLLTSS
jgi:hypothetical protein